MAHITGGGLTENIIRVVPDGLGLDIDASRVALPPVFDWLQREGAVPREEMWRTFNCGIGFVLVRRARRRRRGVRRPRTPWPGASRRSAQVVRGERRANACASPERRSSPVTLAASPCWPPGAAATCRRCSMRSPRARSMREIVGVFSDSRNAPALRTRARPALRWSARSEAHSLARGIRRANCSSASTRCSRDWIVCAGYLRMLDEAFVDALPRPHAQHPSLAAAGVSRACARMRARSPTACAEHGASVHFVTPELDAGAVIAQARVPVLRRRHARRAGAARAGASSTRCWSQALRLAAPQAALRWTGNDAVPVDGHALLRPAASAWHADNRLRMMAALDEVPTSHFR